MRAAEFVEDLALDGGAGEAAELGNEFAHRPTLTEIAVAGDMGGEVALQPCRVVPMGGGGLRRPPLLPIGIGRRRVDQLATEPSPAHREVRIEPDICPDELYEPPLVQQARRGPMDREPSADA